MGTEQAAGEFIASRISSNVSSRTIGWYEGRLRPFIRYCPTFLAVRN